MDKSNVDSVYVGGRVRKYRWRAITSRAYLASKVANG